MYDYDPWAEMEAMEDERRDADREMAEMAAVGNAMARARARGVCQHTSIVGYLPTPVYPEQEGLAPGQSRCTEGCGATFDSDDEWFYAMEAARS